MNRKTFARRVLLAVLGVFVLAAGCASLRGDWRTASHAPMGSAPDPAVTREAVVQVYAARTFGWRGLFGVHTWVAVKPANANAYTVYEVIGWRLRYRDSVVAIHERAPDARWYGAEPELLADRLNSEAFHQAMAPFNCGDPVPKLTVHVALYGRKAFLERQVNITYSPKIRVEGRTRCLSAGMGYLLSKAVAEIDPTKQYSKMYKKPTGEMFEVDQVERALIEAGVATDPTVLRDAWDKTVNEVLVEATLTRPRDSYMQTGGRVGRHSEHLGHILSELQFLQRAYPGATW